MSLEQPTCHGCKHCWYTAPGGQAWNQAPHSRCTDLAVDVPMILGEHQKWTGSEIPSGCTRYPSYEKSRTKLPNSAILV